MLIAQMDQMFTRKYLSEKGVAYSTLVQNKFGWMLKNMAIITVHNPPSDGVKLVPLTTPEEEDGTEEAPQEAYNIKGIYSFHAKMRDGKLPVIHANPSTRTPNSLFVTCSNSKQPRTNIKFFINTLPEGKDSAESSSLQENMIWIVSYFNTFLPALGSTSPIVHKSKYIGILPFGTEIIAVEYDNKDMPIKKQRWAAQENGIVSLVVMNDST